MSSPKRDWWGYVKSMIKRYPNETNEEETAAVERAISKTRNLIDGADRMKLVEMVFLKKTHTLVGSAINVPCSERTAQRWHADFIRLVGENFRCSGLR